VQYRYIWDDGRVTAFRRPSYNSNGNSFDFQGRQLSCEHFNRRVVRWEHDGSMTVIADSYDGKPLNSPNDIVPHPDGSIWFTDPPYGGQIPEGHPDEAGGPSNPQGTFNPLIGAPNAGAIGGRKRELPTNTYRWDPSGKLEVAIPEDQLPDPNGLCFSPDYKTLYVISTGKGPGDTGPGGDRKIYAFDVQGTKVANKRLYTDMTVDGVKCGPDGMRADVTGHLWCSSNAPSATPVCWCSIRRPSWSGASACPRCAPICALAAPSAIACLWPAANRSICCKSRPRAPRRADGLALAPAPRCMPIMAGHAQRTG